jgi:hypothetical protein
VHFLTFYGRDSLITERLSFQWALISVVKVGLLVLKPDSGEMLLSLLVRLFLARVLKGLGFELSLRLFYRLSKIDCRLCRCALQCSFAPDGFHFLTYLTAQRLPHKHLHSGPLMLLNGSILLNLLPEQPRVILDSISRVGRLLPLLRPISHHLLHLPFSALASLPLSLELILFGSVLSFYFLASLQLSVFEVFEVLVRVLDQVPLVLILLLELRVYDSHVAHLVRQFLIVVQKLVLLSL